VGKAEHAAGVPAARRAHGRPIQHTVDRPATAQPTTTSPLFYRVAPLAGLAVTAGYAAVAVLAGLAATRRRDI
jgi:hypothetical protein